LKTKPIKQPQVNRAIKKATQPEQGSSLIEALISVMIIAFVVVSIMGGFSQQQLNSRTTSRKNVAAQLAEQRLEELLKFPTPQMITETYIDYIIHKDEGFEIYDTAANPNVQKQYRRTTDVNIDLLGQIATIRVTVEFPLTGANYPFKVLLETKRGIK